MLLQSGTSRRLSLAAIAAVVALALAGCADSPDGKVGATALAPGQNCKSVQRELDRLVSRGVASKIEAANAGRKLSSQAQADVDRYNNLLGQYLGGRCHV